MSIPIDLHIKWQIQKHLWGQSLDNTHNVWFRHANHGAIQKCKKTSFIFLLYFMKANRLPSYLSDILLVNTDSAKKKSKAIFVLPKYTVFT